MIRAIANTVGRRRSAGAPLRGQCCRSLSGDAGTESAGRGGGGGREDSGSGTAASEATTIESAELKRVMYHARQRGWLELDVIVGNWATENRRTLATDPALMADFKELLAVENPELFKYLTRQMDPPEEEAYLNGNVAFQRIRESIDSGLPDEARASKAWVPSGWHDK